MLRSVINLLDGVIVTLNIVASGHVTVLVFSKHFFFHCVHFAIFDSLKWRLGGYKLEITLIVTVWHMQCKIELGYSKLDQIRTKLSQLTRCNLSSASDRRVFFSWSIFSKSEILSDCASICSLSTCTCNCKLSFSNWILRSFSSCSPGYKPENKPSLMLHCFFFKIGKVISQTHSSTRFIIATLE